MAFLDTPTELFSTYTNTSTDFTISFTDFDDLDSTTGDAAGGDSRKILYAIAKEAYEWFDGLPEADQPTKMDIRQSSRSDNDTGETITTYSFEFRTTATGVAVSNE